MSQTRIAAELTTLTSAADAIEASNDDDDDGESTSALTYATAILRHSYLEDMCGVNVSLSEDRSSPHELPDNPPAVLESIECIVPSQLEIDLELWDDEDEAEQFKHGPEC
jgi:hypothetical protein